MSSLVRMLGVLDVFSEDVPVWTVDRLTEDLGYSRSTAYRYVKELCEAGLLVQIGGGNYMLGPRIIEMDRQIQICDPLLAAGQTIMPGLLDMCGKGALRICCLYGDKLILIHQITNISGLEERYPRGLQMPRVLGAASKLILAHLPERQAIKIFLNHQDEIKSAGLGESWEDFRANLRQLRLAKSSRAYGEIDPDAVGIAAPIFGGDGPIVGSLSLVVKELPFSEMRLDTLSDQIQKGAEQLTNIIADLSNPYSESPSAVAMAIGPSQTQSPRRR